MIDLGTPYLARQDELAELRAVAEVVRRPAIGHQVEGDPAGQRLVPQKLVVPTERGAVRVGVLAAGVGPDVEGGVDQHAPIIPEPKFARARIHPCLHSAVHGRNWGIGNIPSHCL